MALSIVKFFTTHENSSKLTSIRIPILDLISNDYCNFSQNMLKTKISEPIPINKMPLSCGAIRQ